VQAGGPRFLSGTFDLSALEGGQQQQQQQGGGPRAAKQGGTAAKAQGVVAVFLPRNTDLKQVCLACL